MTNDKKELSNIAFSKDAASYDQSSRYAPLRECYPKIVAEAFRRPFTTVLDIGCGTGALLSMIHEKGRDTQLSGIDLSREMIKTSKEKLPKGAELRISDSENIPFRDGAFDLVTCTFSFHHYPNPKRVMEEIRKVLSSTGRLIMADPLIPSPGRQLMNLFVPFSQDGTVRYYSKNEMIDLATSAGLNVLAWSKLNWHSYMMTAGANKNMISR